VRARSRLRRLESYGPQFAIECEPSGDRLVGLSTAVLRGSFVSYRARIPP